MSRCKKLCVLQTSPEGEDDDRISDLPDGVIGLILSLVPIEDAVKTSVLSRDWEHKWTFMRDLEFIDICRSSEDKRPQFMNFVSRVLNRTRDSTLRSFSLACYHKYDPSFFETWISMALARKVESLKIRGYRVGRLDSRWCFSGWTSLTELDIYLGCTLVIPFDNYCFRSLKKLQLLSSTYHGNLKIKTVQIPTGGCIILTFPVLESISFSHCEWLDVNFVEIHAPELTSFYTNCLEERKDYEIKIFAAKLAMFESRGSINETIDLHTPAVSCAKLFHISPSNEQEYQTTLLPRSHKVLKQVSGVKHLELSGDIVKAFKALIPTSISRLVYPFGRLEELHLGSSGYNYEDTLNLLKVVPPLVRLTICVLFWEDNCERTEPCQPKIVSKLEEIKITDFSEKKVQYDFSKFVLENASNLKGMCVHVCEQSDLLALGLLRKNVWEELVKLKPHSSRCRVTMSSTSDEC